MPYEPDDSEDRDAPQTMDLEAARSDDDPDDEDVCSNCGYLLHEDAAVCPKCGEWVVDPSLAGRRSRTWLWPFGIAFLVLVVLWLWSGIR